MSSNHSLGYSANDDSIEVGRPRRAEALRESNRWSAETVPRFPDLDAGLSASARGTIQIWTCLLDAIAGPDLECCWISLADDERERANRFSFPLHRRRYVAGRGTLRRLLAAQLGIAPEEVQLSYGRFGKPTLDSLRHEDELAFNVSHCEGFALIAVARGVELGVDVEDCTREVEHGAVARMVFSTRERNLLNALRGTQRSRFFFRCWTAREAFSKCTGEGLAQDPEAFSLFGDQIDRPEPADQAGIPVEGWNVCEIPLPAPMVGSIAVRGAIGAIATGQIRSGIHAPCASTARDGKVGASPDGALSR